jgi:hypothetical protein
MSLRSKRTVRRTIRPTVVTRSAEGAGVVMHDTSGRLIVASEQAAMLLGFAGPSALVGRPALFEDGRAIGADGTPLRSSDQPAAIALRTGLQVESMRVGVVQSDTSVRWFDVEANPLFRVGAAMPYAAVSRFIRVPQQSLENGSGSCYAIARSWWKDPGSRSGRHHGA